MAENAITLTDTVDPARARALQATLGDLPTIEAGDPLPPFFHQIYFWDPQPPNALGRDGHPATGAFIPDMGDAKRKWAGGKLILHQPLKAGIKAEKISRVEGMTRKQGRSGSLTFVRIRHDIRQRHALAVTEYQDLVYQPTDAPASEHQTAPTVSAHSTPHQFTTTQLFRYSALTFNGHRIHYDSDYAREAEGYSSLIVHGPLLTQLMLDFASRQYGTFAAFSYRNVSPLCVDETATVCAQGNQLWIKAADGRLCASGQIEAA